MLGSAFKEPPWLGGRGSAAVPSRRREVTQPLLPRCAPSVATPRSPNATPAGNLEGTPQHPFYVRSGLAWPPIETLRIPYA